MRHHWIVVFALACLPVPTVTAAPPPPDVFSSVLKVHAWSNAEHAAVGSAVVVQPGVLATNCHVLRGSHRIAVEHGARSWPARLQAGDADKDLCLLAVEDMQLPAARIRSSTMLQIGQPVHAVGHSAGGPLRAEGGRIEALYALYAAKVIQTSASFEQGASGGGLFDDNGDLIGLLTFKIARGGAFHFVIPADWIRTVARSGSTNAMSAELCAFWERDPVYRTNFLSAVWHEANGAWDSLYQHCIEWISAEPENEEARRAMMRAVSERLAR